MLVLVSIIHLIVALGLVVFVLLQDPKGGSMGMFGGGTSNSLFGATGAGNFLTTLTKWLAAIFAVSCLLLTYITSKKGNSLLDTYAPPANNAAAPAAPVEQKQPDGAAAPAAQPPAQPTTPESTSGDKK